MVKNKKIFIKSLGSRDERIQSRILNNNLKKLKVATLQFKRTKGVRRFYGSVAHCTKQFGPRFVSSKFKFVTTYF